MKKRKIVQIILLILFSASIAQASDQQSAKKVLRSFQPIKKDVIEFFIANPKLLTKIAPPKSPDINAYFTSQFVFRNQSYDIVKTDSIVTPYKAHIDIETDVTDNKPCGDISFDNKVMDGWRNIAAAIAATENQNCYVPRTEEGSPIHHRFVFTYRALNEKWELINIFYQNGQPNGRFLVLLDKPSPWFPIITEPLVKTFNQKWYKLLNSL